MTETSHDTVRDLHGIRVLIMAADGPKLASESDSQTFLSAAWEHDAAMVAIPVSRLDAAFFQLSTRLAGAVLQKFVNYRVRLAVIGDVSEWSSASNALRDFIVEANRGRSTWFVADIDELSRRLAS
ncbi:DUF4180 domain-containing protein [Bradyrhizobium sp. 2TAF24]|uniref:DUF4180 domain-containing protein n=1 Tax=Bradyrhizobium sp. 2TAF24 TaxID=3233011 RepID=UPI003F8F0315